MHCNYKIYHNDSYLLISCDRTQMNKNFARILVEENEVADFLNNPSPLFNDKDKLNTLIVCEKPGEAICSLLDRLDIVIAGGGIVTNEKDELLLIFRRGKWDLPKGKIELNEEIMAGAMREVEEETGVKILTASEKPVITYHTYKLKGKDCLKETNWFHMKAKDGQQNLTPQLEEDIEKACWVKKSDLEQYKNGCYPLIWDLLSGSFVSDPTDCN